jgi:Ca2+-binding RTX toxin-like protein
MGDDTLNGGIGNDVLTGGAGANCFVFDADTTTKNTDEIIDFNIIYDTIQLKNSVFSALELGILPTTAFTIDTAANDTAQRVIYDNTSGVIFYDDDGNGSNAAQPIVTIGINLTINNTHFVIV